MAIDLTPFVAKDHDIRIYLHKPFRIDDNIVATNGHMFIAIPDDPSIDTNPIDAPERYIKGVRDLIAKINKRNGTYIPIPEYTLEGEKCYTCEGSGTLERCPECHGEKTLELESSINTYQVTCKTCVNQTSGSPITCHRCNGSGYYNGQAYSHIGNGIYVDGLNYLPVIAELPGVEINIDGDPGELVPFRFDGGIGALMPMRADKAEALKNSRKTTIQAAGKQHG